MAQSLRARRKLQIWARKQRIFHFSSVQAVMIYPAVREVGRVLLPEGSAAPAVTPMLSTPRLLPLDLKGFSRISHPTSAPHRVPSAPLQGHSCARTGNSPWGSSWNFQVHGHPGPALLGPRTLQTPNRTQHPAPCRDSLESQTPQATVVAVQLRLGTSGAATPGSFLSLCLPERRL